MFNYNYCNNSLSNLQVSFLHVTWNWLCICKSVCVSATIRKFEDTKWVTFYILNFFFRTTECPATNLTTIVPLRVLKKAIFLKQLKIQDGCTGLWLADIFSTSSLELLHVKPADLTEMIHKRSSKRVILFQSDLKSSMAAPAVGDIF